MRFSLSPTKSKITTMSFIPGVSTLGVERYRRCHVVFNVRDFVQPLCLMTVLLLTVRLTTGQVQ